MGNSLLAGLLGGTAFFGYYQLRYDVHELAQLVDDTRTSEGGPLQQVQHWPADPNAAGGVLQAAACWPGVLLMPHLQVACLLLKDCKQACSGACTLPIVALHITHSQYPCWPFHEMSQEA